MGNGGFRIQLPDLLFHPGSDSWLEFLVSILGFGLRVAGCGFTVSRSDLRLYLTGVETPSSASLPPTLTVRENSRSQDLGFAWWQAPFGGLPQG